VPIVRDVPGFSACDIVDRRDGAFTTITVAEDKAGVEESGAKASEWVGENAAVLVDGAPTVINGEVVGDG
jgi:phage terminase large subunit-like protein